MLIIIFFVVIWSGWSFSDVAKYFQNKEVRLSEKAEKHILYGSGSAGGHKYGVGKPCKSEFPQDWNDEKIFSTVKSVAANDNLPWKQGKNGYYTADDMVSGIKIRVVLDRERDDIVTAYPINVKRNPCNIIKNAVKTPAPANDNFND